jgi:hypothetical protein
LVFLSLTGCSDDSSSSGTSTAGHGQGGSDTSGGSAGTGQAGQEPAQGGSGGVVSQATGGAGSRGGGAGSAGNEIGDASAATNDAASSDAADVDAGTWKVLFNGQNLDGWTPSPNAAQFYAVDQLNGEPVIHVYPTQPDQSTQPSATLRTNESYSSYVYHEEYKWGTKRYSDRKQTDRDNGICFHICNDPAQVWPESIEFQIGSQAWPGDWVVGNIFMLINKTRAQWPFTMMNGQPVFSETGTKKSIGAPNSYERALAPTQLNSNTDWNILELTVHADKDAEYKVNGTVVNRVFSMECNTGGTWKPLDHGPIALQAEYAEVYFRNIKIKVLP